MGSLVTAAQAALTTWQNENLPTTSEEWAALSDTDVISLYRMENQLKLAITVAQTTESEFYAARSQAFAQFEATKQTEFAALQQLWQTKEDNGFVV